MILRIDDMITISGHHRVELDRSLGFPWGRLIGPSGATVASLGRLSALNIFLGRGQRIELPDGSRWRTKATAWQRFVCPLVVDSKGMALAISTPGPGYAITMRDRAFELAPAEARPGRARRWELLRDREPIGLIHRNPYYAELEVDVPLAAVLLALALSVVGVMGEKDIAPSIRGWGPSPR